jgi:hypothetical protein
MSLGNVHGVLESGYIDFAGESAKTVNLTMAKKRTKTAVNLIVHETQNTSASSVGDTDIPVNNIGNIQAVATWLVGGASFTVNLSAAFYGRIHWYVIDSK